MTHSTTITFMTKKEAELDSENKALREEISKKDAKILELERDNERLQTLLTIAGDGRNLEK